MNSKKAEVVICFDYGTNKVGACIGETYTGACSPLDVLANNSRLNDAIKALVKEWNPNLFVIGMPSKPTEGFKKSIKIFIQTLESQFQLRVEIANEDFTSMGLSGEKKDSESAMLIFQDWFNLNYG